jgi:hypothetical protein
MRATLLTLVTASSTCGLGSISGTSVTKLILSGHAVKTNVYGCKHHCISKRQPRILGSMLTCLLLSSYD